MAMELGANSMVSRGEDDDDIITSLPPGYRFHPTDDEIITHYLTKKVTNCSFVASAIAEIDLNKCEPWDLPKKAKLGEKEWYFFFQRDRKYPTGMRTNRATESGYWKATGKDKEVYNQGKSSSCLIGMKKTLVFYKGRAPKGEKTNWVMHEYRLEGQFSYPNLPHKAKKDEWVVCRVFHKSTGIRRGPLTSYHGLTRMNSFSDYHQDDDHDHDHEDFSDLLFDFPSLPPLMGNGSPSAGNISTLTSTQPMVGANSIFNQHHLIHHQLIPTPIFRNFWDPPLIRGLAAVGSGSTCTSDQQAATNDLDHDHQKYSNEAAMSSLLDAGLDTGGTIANISSAVNARVKRESIIGDDDDDELEEDPSVVGPISDLDYLWDSNYL